MSPELGIHGSITKVVGEMLQGMAGKEKGRKRNTLWDGGEGRWRRLGGSDF